MKTILSILLSMPLLAQSATHQLSCPTIPPLTGGATRTCTVTLTYGGAAANITTDSIRVTIPPDVQSVLITAGAGSTVSGKAITVNNNSAVLAGILNGIITNTVIPEGVVIYNVAFTFKPVLTASTETVSIAAGDASNVAAALIPVAIIPTSLSLPVSNKCDKNNDGVVNVADENVMIGFVLTTLNGGGIPVGCDSNADGQCNTVDIQIIHNGIAGACTAAQ